MTTDRVGKLLERVARDTVRYIRVDTESLGHDWDASEWLVAEKSVIGVLKRLAPLLRAGQEMSEHRGGCCPELDRLQDDWDNALDALATLEGRDGK